MELDSIDCMTSSDVIDDEEIHHHNHHHLHHNQLPSSLSKPHSNSGNNNSTVSSAGHPSTTSVHELLECPVCTNSMYPPIHQVSLPFQYLLWISFFFTLRKKMFSFGCLHSCSSNWFLSVGFTINYWPGVFLFQFYYYAWSRCSLRV